MRDDQQGVVAIAQAVEGVYEQRWGRPARRARFATTEYSIDVCKWTPETNGEGVTIYATIGASNYSMPESDPSHRVEYFVGLLPECDAYAEPLATLSLYPFLHNVNVDAGHTLALPDPFCQGSPMHVFLVARPAPGFFAAIEVGSQHVEFLQAIPIHDVERDFRAANGDGDLRDLWEREGVRFWDPFRRPPRSP